MLVLVLVLEGQFTCKPESRSQKVEMCVVKIKSQSVVLGESGRVELDRSDVLRRESW